ncbi:MAG: FHA domain-containing protein [Muribaculaceae bacterium]|nr:FHA domain-containing protein [Muribaculaceae bacterium]
MNLQSLKGKEIFLGRENHTNRLIGYININGQNKILAFTEPGRAPNSISRANPSQNKAHASIKIDNSGNIILINLKQENVTFVNGNPIVSKRVTIGDSVELGGNHYQLPIDKILGAMVNLINSVSPPPPPTFNISHLERVWNDFKGGQKVIKKKNKNIVLVRSGCGIFTMCAMPTIFFLGPLGLSAWGFALTGIGVLGNAYSFWGLKKNDPDEENEKLVEKLEKEYICPNPKCNRYFGQIKYNLLKSQHKMQCPHCHCKFIEQ